MSASTIISTALQLGAAAIPLVPEVQALFSLAQTLVTDRREPTADEISTLQNSAASAHQAAQESLAAALQAQAQAKAQTEAAQTVVSVLAPVFMALAPAGSTGTASAA